MDCNFHCGEQLSAMSLCEKNRGWTNEKEHIVEAFDKVLGGQIWHMIILRGILRPLR